MKRRFPMLTLPVLQPQQSATNQSGETCALVTLEIDDEEIGFAGWRRNDDNRSKDPVEKERRGGSTERPVTLPEIGEWENAFFC